MALCLVGLGAIGDGPNPSPLISMTERIDFGGEAPAAVKLTEAEQRAIGGCGSRSWCAELQPEHFMQAAQEHQRTGAYKEYIRCL